MPPTILAIAYLLTELASAGISITSVLAQVQQTGIVPKEEWDKYLKEAGLEEEPWLED